MRWPPMFRQREVKGKSDFQLLIGKFVSLLVDPGRSSLPVVSRGVFAIGLHRVAPTENPLLRPFAARCLEV